MSSVLIESTLADLAADLQELVRAAEVVRAHAHAPYSGYRVGAAVRTVTGSIYTGCNVEISSFSHTCCAERIAAFKAVSNGDRQLVAVAVVTDDAPPASPCGACRQVLHDFGADMHVILVSTAGRVQTTTLRHLLPAGFTPDRVLDVLNRRNR